MGIAYFAALASLLVQGAAPAPAPPPQPVLEPVGQWVADFEKDFCSVSRQFGNDHDGPVIGFKALFPNDTSIDVVLVTTDRAPPLNRRQVMRINPAHGPSDAKDHPADIAVIKDSPGVVWSVTVSLSQLKSIADGRQLRIEYGDHQQIIVRPEGIDRALNILDQCRVSLAEYWKLDTASLARLKTLPVARTPRQAWLTSFDYPDQAKTKQHSGTSIIIWNVNVDGVPSDCRILKSAGYPELDDAACKGILARARFDPALDLDGKPIATFLVCRIIWASP